ncbi:hypothetical protein I79_015130 [Cricetulus griseus]|uniref:Uncharacterized protein n=1 Tax=Cricetulus griseus TaxID=10029 RepID=G3HVY4_CRIGR|nr:hypothetical protein I79_015130 [Cricetulus griseus]
MVGKPGACRNLLECVFLQVMSFTTFQNDTVFLLVYQEHLMSEGEKQVKNVTYSPCGCHLLCQQTPHLF